MAEVDLDFAEPPADLVPYVTVFYRFVATDTRIDEIMRAEQAQLRFVVAGGGEYRFVDGTHAAAPPTHLLAATTGATGVRAQGPVTLFGVALTPAGWGAVIGPGDGDAPLHDAAALFGAAAAAIAAAPDLPAMIAAVEPMLRDRARAADPAMLAFCRVIDGWLAAPTPALDALVAATGLSRRQIERRCNRLYGAPPKLLARKHRALRTANAIAAGRRSVDLILAEGFYDQSHLIREVKHFTGQPPRALRQRPGRLAAIIAERRAASTRAVAAKG